MLCVQMIASKYLNDEGEEESLLNSEWAKIGQAGMFVTHLYDLQFGPQAGKLSTLLTVWKLSLSRHW